MFVKFLKKLDTLDKILKEFLEKSIKESAIFHGLEISWDGKSSVFVRKSISYNSWRT